MKLNDQLLLQTSVASLFVIFGVVTKNTMEQIKMPNHPVGKPLGMGLFIIGWLYLGYILSLYKSNKMVFILPSLTIIGTVMLMKAEMANPKPSNMMYIYSALFALSWIVLGLCTGSHLSGLMKYSGLIASVLVITSMMYMLPEQRKQCIVDGPGMPSFVIAFFILTLLNSSR